MVSGVRSSCDVGQHLPAQLIREPALRPPFQVLGHVIERGRHARDLVVALRRRACIELAGAQTLCRLFEGAQPVPRRREDDQRCDGRDGDKRQRPRERQQFADVREQTARRRRWQDHQAGQTTVHLNGCGDDRPRRRVARRCDGACRPASPVPVARYLRAAVAPKPR